MTIDRRPPVRQNPLNSDREPKESPPMHRMLLFVCLLPACSAPVPPQPPKATSEASEKDPWPECAAIRKFLRDNTGEPDKLEIISWESRDPARRPAPISEIKHPHPEWLHKVQLQAFEQKEVTLLVKCREINRFGAPEVFLRRYVFRQGRLYLAHQPEPLIRH
jgi:hypothetical protein